MPKSMSFLCFLVALAWGAGQLQGQDFESRLNSIGSGKPSVANAGDQAIVIPESPVKLIDDVEIPALETGQLALVHVREGMLVEKGFVLATIRDDQAQRALEESLLNHRLAVEKAEDTASINAAAARVDYANEEFQAISRLYAKSHKSESDFRQAKASKEIADNDLRKAQNEKRLAAIQAEIEMVKVNATRDIIERHLLKSPLNGNVVEINKEPGEWVNAGETVFRIARMDKLRVVAFIDSTQYGPSSVAGRRVTVETRLAGRSEKATFPGKIVFTALEQKGLSGTFEVWAEVDNQVDADGYWLLNPGTTSTMTIHLDDRAEGG